MATITRVELIDHVLDNLGVLVPGQASTPEIIEKVDKHIDAIVEMYNNLDGFPYIADVGTASPPDGGEIELMYSLPLSDLIAWQVAPQFNLAGDPALKVAADEAEEMLKRLARPAKTRKVLQTDLQLRVGAIRNNPFNWTVGQ